MMNKETTEFWIILKNSTVQYEFKHYMHLLRSNKNFYYNFIIIKVKINELIYEKITENFYTILSFIFYTTLYFILLFILFYILFFTIKFL